MSGDDTAAPRVARIVLADFRSYASLDTLVTDMTGTNLPIAALFDWLHGQSTPVQGWIPDLSRAREGRLSALRQQPLPTAHLHVILDQAQPTP